MSTLAKWLRRMADRLDGGQAWTDVTVHVADPKAAALEVRKVLLKMKRRNGGEELGLS